MLAKSNYQSPIGEITILSSSNGLAGLWFVGQAHYGANFKLNQVPMRKTAVISLTAHWLDLYFTNQHPEAQIVPLDLTGTEFQQRVYRALLQIPSGKTCTYQQLARPINPAAVRAVANAVANNPISIIIPCHRILGKNGKLTGYAGGLTRKKLLLAHEQTDYKWTT
ncbi:Methylated-DNA--protein-cysteine methyltransferase [Fructilactobacillus florum 8D]|uniref:Methylated-DNA--protein-cysteine methyltransferase n=2 Tax=Fructilactobacillus florum TaxID=640331 RepID=W9EHP4_9LACO|nr:methylated-DNA--[protein]-cysteine S-methyltransferase [Fructilactobacillus florum]ETO40505.1 Methylated-DNA--protein-cysteine methyltransferase [Fructilactobacillus florum 8D]KRM91311.1 6-O-methylguanine-DNA methyltransferase [Fructilactobacillus florum DSM 22689 = JCM 16035]